MSTIDQYVGLRVQRLRAEDLQRKPNKWLAALPQFKTGTKFLDIACGMGFDSIAWARQGKKVTAIDANWGLVQNAADLATREGLKIDFVVADATLLPFREDSFDFCNSENLFEHVPEWQKISSEASRVLKEDGAFLIRCSNRLCPYNHEINHMHFYPWLPDSVKRPILRWVQRNRPAWINYSKFPAVNWFTHRGLAKSLRPLGFLTYEPFDLVTKDLLSANRQKLFFLFNALKQHRFLRYLIYPLLGSVEIIGVKKNNIQEQRVGHAESSRGEAGFENVEHEADLAGKVSGK